MVRPPIKWHGGKHYLAKSITELFPLHHTYVEPFGGAASVLLNKAPSVVEVYNDIDGRLTRLFRILRDRGLEFRERLLLTPYSEVEFAEAIQPSDDEMEQARRDFIRWRQSIGGRGDAFSHTIHRVRRGMADVVSGWLSTIDDELPLIIDRLRTVQIVNRPAIEIIERYDREDTLFYLDPPYIHESRASKQTYLFEMSDDHHRDLIAALDGLKGKFVLSSYPSQLYSEALGGRFSKLEFDVPNHAASSRKKRRMVETIWKNF